MDYKKFQPLVPKYRNELIFWLRSPNMRCTEAV